MPAREIRQGQSLITPDEVNFWLAAGQQRLKSADAEPPGSSGEPLAILPEIWRPNAPHAAAAAPYAVNIHGGRVWAKAVTLN